MLVTKSMRRGRELLIVLLAFVASGESFWYTINGDTTHAFSLCRRLGFYYEADYFAFLVGCGLAGYTEDKHGKKKYKIYQNEWKDLLVSSTLKELSEKKQENLFDLNNKQFDVHGAIQGRQNDKNRFDFKVNMVPSPNKSTKLLLHLG